jgi:hypothetical protein
MPEHAFEIEKEDEPFLYEWDDAVEHLNEKGDSWRLPNRLEALWMSIHRYTIEKLHIGNYWTCDKRSDGTVWYQDFNDGYQYYTTKKCKFLVRAVRDTKELLTSSSLQNITKNLVVVMNETCGYFEKGETYDARETTDGYIIFHHTGWYLIPKIVCTKIQ